MRLLNECRHRSNCAGALSWTKNREASVGPRAKARRRVRGVSAFRDSSTIAEFARMCRQARAKIGMPRPPLDAALRRSRIAFRIIFAFTEERGWKYSPLRREDGNFAAERSRVFGPASAGRSIQVGRRRNRGELTLSNGHGCQRRFLFEWSQLVPGHSKHRRRRRSAPGTRRRHRSCARLLSAINTGTGTRQFSRP